jgi:ATP-dependent DNA helicase RecQ
VDQAATATRSPRDRVVRALDYLGELGLLELKAEGVMHRFYRLNTPSDVAAVAQSLYDRTLKREAREIERLRQVLELAGHDGCLWKKLGERFGERLAQPCGHCAWCLGGRRPAKLLPRPESRIDGALWQKAAELRRQKPDPLSDARCFARFLCGITSPRLAKARLSSDPLFGALAELPFAEVLRRAGG